MRRELEVQAEDKVCEGEFEIEAKDKDEYENCESRTTADDAGYEVEGNEDGNASADIEEQR